MSQHDEAAAEVPTEVVVAFVDDGGFYPRAIGDDPTLDYWKAIAVMATSLRIVGSDWPVVVSTNAPPTDARVLDVLQDAGVEFRDTPYDHRPPPGYYDRFSGSFYLLDALADAIERAPEGGRILTIDPDCVWVRSPQRLVERLDADPDAILAYEITYTPGQPAIGVTQEELGGWFNELGPEPTPLRAPYAGGEFLFGRAERLEQLLPHVDRIWEESLRRFEDGERVRANTEEHVLSYALGQVGWRGGTVNDELRRLWTRCPPNRNVQGDETDLTVWHCLTEKAHGLPLLFDDIVDGHPSLDAADDDYRAHLARRLRVHLGARLRLKCLATSALYGRRREYPPEW